MQKNPAEFKVSFHSDPEEKKTDMPSPNFRNTQLSKEMRFDSFQGRSNEDEFTNMTIQMKSDVSNQVSSPNIETKNVVPIAFTLIDVALSEIK